MESELFIITEDEQDALAFIRSNNICMDDIRTHIYNFKSNLQPFAEIFYNNISEDESSSGDTSYETVAISSYATTTTECKKKRTESLPNMNVSPRMNVICEGRSRRRAASLTLNPANYVSTRKLKLKYDIYIPFLQAQNTDKEDMEPHRDQQSSVPDKRTASGTELAERAPETTRPNSKPTSHMLLSTLGDSISLLSARRSQTSNDPASHSLRSPQTEAGSNVLHNQCTEDVRSHQPMTTRTIYRSEQPPNNEQLPIFYSAIGRQDVEQEPENSPPTESFTRRSPFLTYPADNSSVNVSARDPAPVTTSHSKNYEHSQQFHPGSHNHYSEKPANTRTIYRSEQPSTREQGSVFHNPFGRRGVDSVSDSSVPGRTFTRRSQSNPFLAGNSSVNVCARNPSPRTTSCSQNYEPSPQFHPGLPEQFSEKPMTSTRTIYRSDQPPPKKQVPTFYNDFRRQSVDQAPEISLPTQNITRRSPSNPFSVENISVNDTAREPEPQNTSHSQNLEHSPQMHSGLNQEKQRVELDPFPQRVVYPPYSHYPYPLNSHDLALYHSLNRPTQETCQRTRNTTQPSAAAASGRPHNFNPQVFQGPSPCFADNTVNSQANRSRMPLRTSEQSERQYLGRDRYLADNIRKTSKTQAQRPSKTNASAHGTGSTHRGVGSAPYTLMRSGVGRPPRPKPELDTSRPTRAMPDFDTSRPTRAMPDLDPGRPTRAMPDLDPSRPTRVMHDLDPSRPTRVTHDLDSGRPTRLMPDLDPGRPTRVTHDLDLGIPTRLMSDLDPGRPTRVTHDLDPGRPTRLMSDLDPGRPSRVTHDLDPGRPTRLMSDLNPGRPTRVMHDLDPGRPTRVTHDLDPGRLTRPIPDLDPGRPTRVTHDLDPGRTTRVIHDLDPGRTIRVTHDLDPSRPTRSMSDLDPGRPTRPIPDLDPGRPTQSMPNWDPGRPLRPMPDLEPAPEHLNLWHIPPFS